MKKFTLIFLAVIMCVSALAIGVAAYGTDTECTLNSDGVHDWSAWKTTKNDGKVIVKTRTCACNTKEEYTFSKVAAVEGTCAQPGTKEYWVAAEDAGVYLVDGVITDVKPESDAIIAHELVKVEAKEATCEVDGNIAYSYCKNCDWMQTENGAATNQKAVVLTKDHELVAVERKEATCEAAGNIAYSYCKNCSYMCTPEGMNTNQKAVVLTKDHELVAVERKEPTATENGNIAYSYCKNCDYMCTPEGMNTNQKAVILPATGEAVEPPVTEPTPDTTEPEASKPTGDNSNAIFFVVVLVAVVALGAAAVSFKKREN